MVTLKIHSILPIGERTRGRSLRLIALYVPPKKECLKKERQAFRCCLNKDMEMWDEGSIWRFSNTRTQAARFFCCWRSEKLFPVISHLVTSRTNILLLLAPAVVVVFFFFSPSTDRWCKSFDYFPPSSKGVCLCGTFIKWSYAPVTHFILLAESEESRADPVETFNNILCHVLWSCFIETSTLLVQPICFWGFTPKKGKR